MAEGVSMQRYLVGKTNAGNIAVLGDGGGKCVFVRKTGQQVEGASFPEHIATTEVWAENWVQAAYDFQGIPQPEYDHAKAEAEAEEARADAIKAQAEAAQVSGAIDQIVNQRANQTVAAMLMGQQPAAMQPL
jgi:hypothetical protein